VADSQESTAMIEKKRIWITGASSGIGSELAQQLAAMGNTVVVSARSEDKLQLLAAQESSGRILPLVYDVTVDDTGDEIRSKLSGLVDALDMVILLCHCLTQQLRRIVKKNRR